MTDGTDGQRTVCPIARYFCPVATDTFATAESATASPLDTTKIVYDGDFGIDDTMALLYLCSRRDVELLAVGSVHGNTPADQAAANALAVLEIAGRLDVPVALGAQRPMAQPLASGAIVHGDDGLGGVAPRTDRRAVGVSAAEQLVAVIRANPGCVVVATGPLTNLALALLLAPDIADLAGKVVIMGGTVMAPGNITPFAEANIFNDPEAADLVLSASWPVTLVGLDVTLQAWMGQPDLDRIAASDQPAARLVSASLEHYLGFYRSRHARIGCPLHDPAAAILALQPDLAGYLAAPVSVELRAAGTRGMLLVDRREFAAAEATGELRPPVQIATTIDGRGTVDTFLSGLLSLSS